MSYVLIYIIHIETVLSPLVESWERSIQTVGNRLVLTLVDVCGKSDRTASYNGRDDGCSYVEVNCICSGVRSNEITEACPFESRHTETAEGCEDTYTNSDDCEEDKWESHGIESMLANMM